MVRSLRARSPCPPRWSAKTVKKPLRRAQVCEEQRGAPLRLSSAEKVGIPTVVGNSPDGWASFTPRHRAAFTPPHLRRSRYVAAVSLICAIEGFLKRWRPRSELTTSQCRARGTHEVASRPSERSLFVDNTDRTSSPRTACHSPRSIRDSVRGRPRCHDHLP